MKILTTWLDGSVGESRMALVDEGRPVALAVWRASDVGRRARWGEAYVGRITAVDRRRRGAFVALGLSEDQGFLPLGADGRVRVANAPRAVSEGELVTVLVTREAAGGKNAVLELLPEPASGAPRFLARHRSDEHLIDAPPADAETRVALDEAFDEAIARTAAIPGGGRLTIDLTAALTAIDVDAADRVGAADPERFALDLNLAAATEALRQIRLRDLGGIIAIDFVSMRPAPHREAVMQALRAHRDPWGLNIAQMSKFGIVEMARPRLRRPLREALCDETGAPTIETLALAALRGLETTAMTTPSRIAICDVRPPLMTWLETAPFDWRAALTGRIGTRWRLGARADLRRAFETYTD